MSDPAAESSRLEALVRRIAAGDDAALSAFWDATHALVFGLAQQLLRDGGAAEEATLDVFLQVWREADRYDPRRGAVVPWLMNMARCRVIDRLRIAGGAARRLERPLQEDAHDRADGDVAPDQASWLAERRERIVAALERLVPEQREAIRCAFLLGMSHTEVAEHFQQPLGTIKTRIRTGLVRLREILHPLGASA